MRTINVVIGTPGGAGVEKPNASNTGYRTSLTTFPGTYSANTNGETVSGLDITGQLHINADNVTVRDCNVQDVSGILVFGTGSLIEYTKSKHLATVSAVDTLVQYVHIAAFEEDAFHITAASGSEQTVNLTIRRCFVDNPQPPPGAHQDGIQVRGVDGLLFEYNHMQMGTLISPEMNACVFLESANGGNENMTVDNNWLYGSAFSFMLSSAATGTNAITNNKVGGDIGFTYCFSDPSPPTTYQTVSGNIDEDLQTPITLCGLG